MKCVKDVVDSSLNFLKKSFNKNCCWDEIVVGELLLGGIVVGGINFIKKI
jgi:hypothetical protein